MREDTRNLGITNVFYCPDKNFSYTLQGSFSIGQGKFLEVEVDYCKQKFLDWKYGPGAKRCFSREISDSIIQEIEV